MVELNRKIIESHKEPLWTKESYRRELEVRNVENGINIIGPKVRPDNWIDQHSEDNFSEFDKVCGYGSDDMRNNGCGISSLHVILSTLASGYDNPSFTVGELAAYAISFHRDDLKDVNGNLVKRGHPVLSNSIDWYHDALAFTASTFGVNSYRAENLSLEDMAQEMAYLIDIGKKPMIMTSVAVNYKRPESDRKGLHLIVVNGFHIDDNGKVDKVCVTDSSLFASNNCKENTWVEIDDHVRRSFKGKAIFFLVDC